MANPWPKGTSGNPQGRPRNSQTWAAILKRVGREKNESGVTRKVRVARQMYDQAEGGDRLAFMAIADREDGAVPNTSNVTMAGAFTFVPWSDDEVVNGIAEAATGPGTDDLAGAEGDMSSDGAPVG
jgi:hypothetical protein